MRRLWDWALSLTLSEKIALATGPAGVIAFLITAALVTAPRDISIPTASKADSLVPTPQTNGHKLEFTKADRIRSSASDPNLTVTRVPVSARAR
jgi:hypothetical protein